MDSKFKYFYQGEFSMNKIKKHLTDVLHYLKHLPLDIKILYALSCIFFAAEYVNGIVRDGIYTLPLNISYIGFSWLYAALLPIVYIIINIVLILAKKINNISLIILFVLRILHPSTMIWVIVVLDQIYRTLTESYSFY